MRTSLVLLALLTGCAGEKTDATDGATDDSDTIDDGTPPLVPEEFANLWNTSGECSNEFGDGDKMYMVGEARAEADGSFTATEKVWFFYADEPNSEDCVDTFELSGNAVFGDPGELGYVSAEEFYDVRREFVENNCNERYNRIYRSDDDGLYQRLMIDTLNEFNDQPNENSKISIFHEERNFFGEGYVSKSYAQENGSKITPDGETYGPPASYRWIGTRCNVAFGGGGGGGGG